MNNLKTGSLLWLGWTFKMCWGETHISTWRVSVTVRAVTLLNRFLKGTRWWSRWTVTGVSYILYCLYCVGVLHRLYFLYMTIEWKNWKGPYELNFCYVQNWFYHVIQHRAAASQRPLCAPLFTSQATGHHQVNTYKSPFPGLGSIESLTFWLCH